jgi:3-hydroxyacyl-[acyl-carrier-protein] dehydratase
MQMSEPTVLGIEVITSRLMHRYPFLLLDRVLEVVPGKRIVALKNVTVNEPFFAGHFPGYPVMPGVLIIEALAQAGGVLTWESASETERQSVVYLVGINDARFKQTVRPGDQLILKVELVQARRNLLRCHGRAEVDGGLVAEAEVRMAFGPRP